MAKFSFFLLVIVATTTAIQLPCRYDIDTKWWAIDEEYYCELSNSLDILNTNTQITSVSGEHMSQKSNDDVAGFRADNKTMHYLPRGLEKFFNAEKITFIAIWTTGLKEIHQSDLSPFTKLKVISVFGNEIEVIERDLFKFNPEVVHISLEKNRIKSIDENVFKHLKNLETIFLGRNVCISKSPVLVLDLVKEIKQKCKA